MRWISSSLQAPLKVEVRDLAVGYGGEVVQRGVSFDVRAGSIFAIMGGSGCGKSTVLKSLIGLIKPSAGTIHFGMEDFWSLDAEHRGVIGRRFGVLFQEGALWSSMTVEENVSLPLQMFTRLDAPRIAALARLKLALIGLPNAGDIRPAKLSGGMRKRVGLARALALEPDILFLDEPSAGLDPISSKRLDDLIVVLRDGLGVTVIMVSHELPSLLSICDDGIFLDAASHAPLAHGAPREMRDTCTNSTVQAFMHRALPTLEKPTGQHGT